MNFENLDQMAKHEGGLNRRLFMSYIASLSTLPWLGLSCAGAKKISNLKENPFTLGVASGDPDHEGMVLWTKLAPKPLQLDSGMPIDAFVEVDWEVATDDQMKSIVQSGTALATPHLGHSVHVETKGLTPDRWYWYRFRVGQYESRIGRTRTMPLNSVMPDKLKFAVTSCQNFEQGLFTAYEQMIADDVDLVFHLGDYIYEYKGYDKRTRKHIGPEIENIAQYRQRYAQYKLDKHLQAMHAQCPWWLTWDDHEFDNNCAGDISEQKGVDKITYLKRRAAAYQAYYEMMPLRASAVPTGSDMKLYRKASFGRLADFLVLDTRQYRTDQPNGDHNKPLSEDSMNPNNTLLGKRQKGWMYKSLIQSDARWNVLTQQVMMGMVNRQRKDGKAAIYSMDQWPGYSAEKMAIMRFLEDRKISNPVVLTGDIHSNWVNELRVDDFKMDTKVIATEFVTTSLSSGGNGSEATNTANKYKSNSPFVKFFNAERGYILCELTPEKWISHYKVIDEVLKPGGKTQIRASYQVNTGDPTAHKI